MAMPVIKASPQKRKHTEEYHDPDYPNQNHVQQNNQYNVNTMPPCTKRKKEKDTNYDNNIKAMEEEHQMQKVRAIIEREFQREILLKQQQLQEIDKRLDYAKRLLERLRYSIVAAYYRKQDIPLAPNNAFAIRGSRTLFEREEKGPQMQIHPAIKQVIGKKPRTARPQRSAAQLAKETIRAKTDAAKKEEKQRQKLIQKHGIVINHIDQENADQTKTTALAMTEKLLPTITVTADEIATKELASSKTDIKSKVKALNTTRLNNKLRHLIVVGNTSQYIRGEQEYDNNNKLQCQHIFTHKWLVYVQSKDSQNPLERYVKKVRFYLHHSYRPNDVIDIHVPPYHISRRGWGEFPIRVQLFFHSEYHQKPIQLVHNIILDKTLTGIQTLGAETILEIYLRHIEKHNQNRSLEAQEQDRTELSAPIKSIQPEIEIKPEELIDDDINLFEFLNKIDASPISADLEKINPTIGEIDSLTTNIKTPSPVKDIKQEVITPSSLKKEQICTPPEEFVSTGENSLENILDKEPYSITNLEGVDAIFESTVAVTSTYPTTLLFKSSTIATETKTTATAMATSMTILDIDSAIQALDVGNANQLVDVKNSLERPTSIPIESPLAILPKEEETTETAITTADHVVSSPILKLREENATKKAETLVTTTTATISTTVAMTTPTSTATTTTITNTCTEVGVLETTATTTMNSIVFTSSETVSITTITTSTTSMQQSICSTITKKPNIMAIKRSPILILNKNNRILTPVTTTALSMVKKTILPINNRSANIETNTSNTTEYVVQGITSSMRNNLNVSSLSSCYYTSLSTTKTPDLSNQKNSILKPVSAINNNVNTSPACIKQLFQKKIVKVLDTKGQIKYIPMLVNAQQSNAAKFTTTPIAMLPVKTTTAIAVTAVISNTTTTVTTSVTSMPCTFNMVPSSSKTVTIVKPKINQMFDTKTCTVMSSSMNPLTLNVKPTILRVKADGVLQQQQQNKPKIIKISQIARRAIIPTIPVTPTSKLNSLHSATNENVYVNHNEHQQQKIQEPQHYQQTQQKQRCVQHNNHSTEIMKILEKQSSAIMQTSPLSVSPKTIVATTATEKFNAVTNNTNRNVLYKEGKLCIIDPIQMKLKQQQKKQISLLKPEISLLKQQHQQHHHQQKTIETFNSNNINKNTITIKSPLASSLALVGNHYDDINETIGNWHKLEKATLEKKFFKQHFRNIQTAVEYLLKRIPIDCPNDDNKVDNESTSSWWWRFQTLSSIMQKSVEWLRAKEITILLNKHEELKRIVEKANKKLWTTREVVLFARQYYYTPPLKMYRSDVLKQQTMDFATLIKHELKQQQKQCQVSFNYTLNKSIKLRKSLRKLWQKFMVCETYYKSIMRNSNGDRIEDCDADVDNSDEEFVDIINTITDIPTPTRRETSLMYYNKRQQFNITKAIMILKAPSHLENECYLVQDICRNVSQFYLVPEELEIGILYPATLTILAHCLHLFIEKLLRRTIALKYQWKYQNRRNNNNDKSVESTTSNVLHIFNRDIRQMLYCTTNCNEFDFLTNQQLSISSPFTDISMAGSSSTSTHIVKAAKVMQANEREPFNLKK